MPSNHDHDHDLYNTVVLKLLDLYSSFGFTPQHFQYTVLASFFLICSKTTNIKVISLGTGTKCLPANRLSPKGEIVNDSHAEVLARRSAVLWFLEEIQRICSVDAYRSPWLDVSSDARYALREGVKLNLYISTVPCKFLYLSYFCLS
jgi:tRNA-specific adenosine deaminase 1